jgi:uncharacterized protein YhbP (UPF0306 family)
VRHVDAKGAALCSNCIIIVEEKTKHMRSLGPESQSAGTRRV